MNDVACIDLFCGAGGLTHGLILEGVKVVAGVDVDEACRHPFEANNAARFINEDIERLAPERVGELFGDAKIRVLAGCAPCQPFSSYRLGRNIAGDPRSGLLYQFGRLIDAVGPDLVVTENVPLVAKHTVFHDFVDTLKKSGYYVYKDVGDCSRYGLPQRRRRMVLLASRLGPIELLAPTHIRPKTVRDAIGHLPPIAHGEADPDDVLHAAAKLSDLNLQRIRASRPGGTRHDWPKHLRYDGRLHLPIGSFPDTYGRMEWDKLAPTITTGFYAYFKGRFGHPEQDRAISLREGAILQGFPKYYSFIPDGSPVRFTTVGRMIGNAVPVTLGQVIGRSIVNHLRAGG